MKMHYQEGIYKLQFDDGRTIEIPLKKSQAKSMFEIMALAKMRIKSLEYLNPEKL